MILTLVILYLHLLALLGPRLCGQAKLYLPNSQGQLHPIQEATCSNQLRTELGYNLGSLPLTLVIANCIEQFIPIPVYSTLFTQNIVKPGVVLGGLYAHSHCLSHYPNFLQSISIGARSVFFLPKTMSHSGYKRIKNYFHLRFEQPTSLMDQWKIFCQLATHPDTHIDWQGQLLFFGHKWLTHKADSAWAPFYYYLYKNTCNAPVSADNYSLWELTFSLFRRSVNYHTDPYIAETAKHLLAMSMGAVSGFRPATNNLCAPVTQLQTVFKEIYRLSPYAPTLMQADFLNFSQPDDYLYYSLSHPSAAVVLPGSRKTTNKITDLAEIRYLLTRYQSILQEQALGLKKYSNEPLYAKC